MIKLMQSFGYALKGLIVAIKEQRNLKIHLVCFIVVCLAGFYFSISHGEWCILLLISALVISLELVNTALENLTDLVTTGKKPLAGKVKDIAAAAVLVAAFAAVVIGVIIFAPYIMNRP